MGYEMVADAKDLNFKGITSTRTTYKNGGDKTHNLLQKDRLKIGLSNKTKMHSTF